MVFSLGSRAQSAGYHLTAFDQIGSTNAEARARGRAGEPGPTWFVTSDQTAGRGRRQRAWIAPKGNLASTILEVTDVLPPAARPWALSPGWRSRPRCKRSALRLRYGWAGRTS